MALLRNAQLFSFLLCDFYPLRLEELATISSEKVLTTVFAWASNLKFLTSFKSKEFDTPFNKLIFFEVQKCQLFHKSPPVLEKPAQNAKTDISFWSGKPQFQTHVQLDYTYSYITKVWEFPYGRFPEDGSYYTNKRK